MKYQINKKVSSRPSVNRTNRRNMLKNMVASLLVILVLACTIYGGKIILDVFLRHPDFIIHRVCVMNNKVLTEREIIRLARIHTNMNIYATSLEPIKTRLEKHPDIETVEISKRHPDMLVIKVYEREPYAIVKSLDGKFEVPIDKEGIMLSPEKMEYALQVPVIEGIECRVYKPGYKLDDYRIPVAMHYVNALLHVPQRTFLNIKRISLTEPNNIIIKTATIDEIHFGNEYSHANVARLIATINDLRFRRVNASRIDLRFKDVAVRSRLL